MSVSSKTPSASATSDVGRDQPEADGPDEQAERREDHRRRDDRRPQALRDEAIGQVCAGDDGERHGTIMAPVGGPSARSRAGIRPGPSARPVGHRGRQLGRVDGPLGPGRTAVCRPVGTLRAPTSEGQQQYDDHERRDGQDLLDRERPDERLVAPREGDHDRPPSHQASAHRKTVPRRAAERRRPGPGPRTRPRQPRGAGTAPRASPARRSATAPVRGRPRPAARPRQALPAAAKELAELGPGDEEQQEWRRDLQPAPPVRSAAAQDPRDVGTAQRATDDGAEKRQRPSSRVEQGGERRRRHRRSPGRRRCGRR